MEWEFQNRAERFCDRNVTISTTDNEVSLPPPPPILGFHACCPRACVSPDFLFPYPPFLPVVAPLEQLFPGVLCRLWTSLGSQ